MISTRTLKKVSAASGMLFGVYWLMHLLNHVILALQGVVFATTALHRFRKFYRTNIVVELIVLLSLATHMASNTLLYLRRQKAASIAAGAGTNKGHKKSDSHVQGTAELTAHRYSGYILSVFIIGHVLASRIAPLIFLGPDTAELYDYSFVTAAVTRHGFPAMLFAAYLIVFGMAGVWHGIYGVTASIQILWFDSSLTGKPFPLALKPVAMIFHIMIIISALGLTGYVSTSLWNREPMIDHAAMTEKTRLHDSVFGAFI